MKKRKKEEEKAKEGSRGKDLLDLFVFLMDRECETLGWAAPANLSQDFLPLFFPRSSLRFSPYLQSLRSKEKREAEEGNKERKS